MNMESKTTNELGNEEFFPKTYKSELKSAIMSLTEKECRQIIDTYKKRRISMNKLPELLEMEDRIIVNLGNSLIEITANGIQSLGAVNDPSGFSINGRLE